MKSLEKFDGYRDIASVYDKLNAEIDYSKWADFIETCFDMRLKKKPELVLDLACGTGRMAIELAKRGYDMIGADASGNMLSVAFERAYDAGQHILFLEQDMREFELYGTVGAVVCCLDSINYLTEDGDMEKCFSLVHNYLDPDGLFLFDMNTPNKFRNVYGTNAYILEDGEGAFCGWQNCYDPESKLCEFRLSLFTPDERGLYTRSDEIQYERCYSEEEIRGTLEKCGFEVLGFYSGFKFEKADDETERWYICAVAKK